MNNGSILTDVRVYSGEEAFHKFEVGRPGRNSQCKHSGDTGARVFI